MTGANGTIDFNPRRSEACTTAMGIPRASPAFGDDSPLRATAVFGQNRYIAFLTNDLTEGAANTDDTNGRAVITAAAADPHNTFEIVQAIVQQVSFPEPPAVITMLGPTPDFDGGTSTSKLFSGNDCTDPNVHVPVIAVVGSDAVTSAAEGVQQAAQLRLRDQHGNVHDRRRDHNDRSGLDQLSVASTTSRTGPRRRGRRRDRFDFRRARRNSRRAADRPHRGGLHRERQLPGAGLLFVTGRLTFAGTASWNGTMLLVGKESSSGAAAEAAPSSARSSSRTSPARTAQCDERRLRRSRRRQRERGRRHRAGILRLLRRRNGADGILRRIHRHRAAGVPVPGQGLPSDVAKGSQSRHLDRPRAAAHIPCSMRPESEERLWNPWDCRGSPTRVSGG